MKTEFIPYEQALKLKELGFDEPCFGWFTNSYLRIGGVVENKHVQGEDEILAPLYQQAFRWFRDKKLSDASINRHGEADGGYSYRWEIVYEYGTLEERHFKMGYNTYEEAELACLNKLIEIVKNGKQ